MDFRKTRRGVCCPGFKAAGVKKGKYGVALISADEPCLACGVFTKNSVKSPTVEVTKKAVSGKISLVVANSGNANACTKTGLSDARKVQNEAARLVGAKPSQVAVASTGIIGRKLDTQLVLGLSNKAVDKLACTAAASLSAAKAIMTTDTKPKQFSVEYNGIAVGGICKGSGMIAPNMATMLCFITTDAKLSKRELERALKESVSDSFNMVSVDGECSTNDMMLLLSSGLKECSLTDFQKALDEVTINLAKMIAADGEGAKKLIEV